MLLVCSLQLNWSLRYHKSILQRSVRGYIELLTLFID